MVIKVFFLFINCKVLIKYSIDHWSVSYKQQNNSCFNDDHLDYDDDDDDY